jgi:hypothetical protein
MASGNYDAARQSLTEGNGIAQALAKAAKASLYEERYLALAESVMGDLQAALAARSREPKATEYRSEADSRYANALAVWARWRSQNLASAYAAIQEQTVLRARAALERRR